MRRLAERALPACGVLGPALFVAVFLVEGLVHPAGYRPARHTVSAFVLGPYGGVQVASFIVSGTLIVAFAAGLAPALRRAHLGGRGVALAVGLVGAGLVVAGLFPADAVAAGASTAAPYPPGVPVPPGRTTHGVLHDLGGTPLFLGLPVVAGLIGIRTLRAGDRTRGVVSLGCAVAFVALFVLTSTALAGALPPIGGVLQRATLLVGLGWLAALALVLRDRSGR